MAKRGLMDRVKAAAERVGEPVARTLVRTTAAAVRTMDKLQHATAKAKPSTVARTAAKVATKTAAKTATRAADTVRSAAGRARKGPRSAPGADMAEARTIDARAAEIARAKEHRGRGGLEPVRYEDWEVKGLASDF